MEKENEYKSIFVAEASENHSELNRLLTRLEKDSADKKTINALFRITHTLKGNALGMGFGEIAELSHTLEDFFGLLRDGKIVLDESGIGSLYKALDVLGQLLKSLDTGKPVAYKGIKTKLDVMIRKTGETSPSDVQKQTVESQEEVSAPQTDEHADDDHISFSDMVQVPVRKLDNLLNLVAELIIEKDRFMASSVTARNEYNRLNRIASDLQYSVMDVRLVQVGFLFNKFHRVVRDAATSEEKKVNLKIEGADTEIDRNVLQVMSDSLIHLIRNAIGHGIEFPDERVLAGKTPAGNITLRATGETDAVIVEISDDGKGIDIDRIRNKAVEKALVTAEVASQLSDQEVIMLIFEPGFSTMDSVTAIAGRGVGMDVVKKALDSIGGNIEVKTTKGQGSCFRLTLPASMAVKSTLLFELNQAFYAMPLSYTEAVVSLYVQDIHKVGAGLMATYLGQPITLVFLNDLLNNYNASDIKPLQRGLSGLHPEHKLDIVIVTHNGKRVGLVVDKLHQQKEIVEKPLSKPVEKVNFISGVTILGNGGVCIVLNVATIVTYIFNTLSKGRLTKTGEL